MSFLLEYGISEDTIKKIKENHEESMIFSLLCFKDNVLDVIRYLQSIHVLAIDELLINRLELFFLPKEEIKERFERYIKNYPSENYAEFKTQDTLMEFCDRRVSKGNALVTYCKATNLPISKVMAFGDTTNDNLMIKNAGWGVCLLNGSSDTKAICDDITEFDVDNDGFAHYIEKHILNR